MDSQEIEIITPEHIKLKFSLAGLGSRGAALLIDVILLGIVYFAFIFALIWSAGSPLLSLLPDSFIIALIIIINFLIIWGYFALFEFLSGGRTLGKMALGLRAIQENGQSITFLSSGIRNLLRIIDFLPVFFFIGMLLIFLHPRHKRVGDIASGTIVVYDRKRRKDRAIEKVLKKRFNLLEPLTMDEWTINKFTSKDWQLLKIYIERQIVKGGRGGTDVTEQVADILLSKAGLEDYGQGRSDIEANLVALYLTLKDEFF